MFSFGKKQNVDSHFSFLCGVCIPWQNSPGLDPREMRELESEWQRKILAIYSSMLWVGKAPHGNDGGKHLQSPQSVQGRCRRNAGEVGDMDVNLVQTSPELLLPMQTNFSHSHQRLHSLTAMCLPAGSLRVANWQWYHFAPRRYHLLLKRICKSGQDISCR